MKSFKSYLEEAKLVYFIAMPLVNKGKLKKTDSMELKAPTAKAARERAAKEFGLRPDQVKAVAKYADDKHMNEKKDGPCWDDYEMVGMKKKNGKEVPNCVPKEEHGAGDEGTNKLVNKYKKDTPLEEEAPTTNTSGVDMNTTGKPKKQDKRSRFDIDKMFRRANGVN